MTPDDRALIQALLELATECGCYCEGDGPGKDQGKAPRDWCPFCLMAEASARVEALVTRVEELEAAMHPHDVLLVDRDRREREAMARQPKVTP